MPGPFTATAEQLSSVAGFLGALGIATDEQDGTRIVGSFTVQLPDNGSEIEAAWDETLGQYVLSDQVGR